MNFVHKKEQTLVNVLSVVEGESWFFILSLNQAAGSLWGQVRHPSVSTSAALLHRGPTPAPTPEAKVRKLFPCLELSGE